MIIYHIIHSIFKKVSNIYQDIDSVFYNLPLQNPTPKHTSREVQDTVIKALET